MAISTTKSALEIANWFYYNAQINNLVLENEKIQHLLFLSQIYYAIDNNNQYLMPSLFLCDDSGFCEPNIKKILEFGFPLMQKSVFPSKVTIFLESIWKRYSSKSALELRGIIKNSQSYLDNYIPSNTIIVMLPEIVSKFTNKQTDSKKVLVSQNGPVVVSQWQPRKIKVNNIQGEENV